MTATMRRAVLLVMVLAVVLSACGAGPADPDEVAGSPVVATPTDGPPEPSTPPEAPGTPAQPQPQPAEPTTQPAAPVASPAQPAEPAEADGTWPALIVSAEAQRITLDKVDILSGAEADAARVEDGLEPMGDVDAPYVRNRNPRLRTIPVAADVVVQVYDCSGACALVSWTYADLVARRPLPYGAAGTTPFTVTIRGGEIVAIAEVYLA